MSLLLRSANFRISQPAPDEVRIEIYGNLDERSAGWLEDRIDESLAPLDIKTFNVVVNTMGMTECSDPARDVLVRVQKILARRARRTAFLDDRPHFRGLALWVMHLAGDMNAKAVATRQQVIQWLASTSHRVESARAIVEGKDPS